MRPGATSALVPLLCLGLIGVPALAGSWSLPDESRGSRVAPLLLLSRPEVRDDLRISPDQVEGIDKAIVDFHQKASALKGKAGEAAVAGRRAVDEAQAAWIEQHLTPDQVDRLWQVDLHWEGPAAMTTRASVAEALSLSDEQKAALDAALRERNAQRDKTRDVAAANKQFGLRALSILSEGQKQRWTRMVGRPIAHKVASAPSPAPVAR